MWPREKFLRISADPKPDVSAFDAYHCAVIEMADTFGVIYTLQPVDNLLDGLSPTLRNHVKVFEIERRKWGDTELSKRQVWP